MSMRVLDGGDDYQHTSGKQSTDGEQLTLRVGGDALGVHMFGTLKVTGDLRVDMDLNLGDEVRVQVVNAEGEVICGSAALIEAPSFAAHRDKHGDLIAVERKHKAKVEG